ncbi:SixA phosphatase family protein [Phreatobacter cathodiphilus]|nr:histidine phosphatase family protein [Phreatobacter cathodiphilus]
MGTTMRRLILFRHTKSDWPAGMVDFERPLAPRGRRAAPLMGRMILDRGLVPDRVVVSPAARTVETWALASAGLVQLPPGEQDGRIYEAPAYLLAAVIRETADEVGTLLLVGHNPGIESLCEEIVGGGPPDQRRRLSRKYPTGGLAVIDCAIDRWADLAPRCGTLVSFTVPRDLDSEAE